MVQLQVERSCNKNRSSSANDQLRNCRMSSCENHLKFTFRVTITI